MTTRLLQLIDDIDRFVSAGRPTSDLKPLLALLRDQVEALAEQQLYAEGAKTGTEQNLPGFEAAV